MRTLFALLMFCSLIFSSQAVLADPPDIMYNVLVMSHVNPSQCPSDWRGDASPAEGIDISRFGGQDVEGPGVASCTGCAVNQANNCVCSRCYSFYSGD